MRDLRTTVNDYVAFINEACDNWLDNPENDPLTVNAMNSSVSISAMSMSLSHSISTPAGAETITRTTNVGVITASPTAVQVPAAGAAGSVTATVSPTDTPILAESSDASWLTAVVKPNAVDWTAAENAGPTRTATLRLSTSPSSYAQVVSFTQAGV